MSSIFSPRFEATKGGVLQLRPVPQNDKEYDKYYFDPVIKKTVKKIGEGEDDFVIEEKVVFDKRLIKDVIASQSNLIPNVDEAIERFALTGDLTTLPKQMEDGAIQDFTQLPEDHAELMQFMNFMAVKYDNLPSDLKKGMSMSEFINNVSDKDIEDYYASKEVKKEEEKEVK